MDASRLVPPTAWDLNDPTKDAPAGHHPRWVRFRGSRLGSTPQYWLPVSSVATTVHSGVPPAGLALRYPGLRVGVGAFEGGTDALVAGVDVLGPDQAGDTGHAELLLDGLAGGDDDELAAGGTEGFGVPVQHVHERGAKIG